MYNPIPSSLQSSMANKVRRMPAGVTPPLKYMMAMEDVAEAQRQLGIARDAMQPQNMPTVMAQLQQQVDPQDAPQNDMPGRAEMLAKAQGLGALNQGQRIPGAPQGQPPQGVPQMAQAQGPQPMQRMAAGGLARLPSNLPQEYAGGGIIAFGEQDGEQLVPTAPALQDPEFDSEGLPRSASEKARIISDNTIVQKRIAAMGQEATQKSITKNQYDAQTSGLAKRMQDYYKPRGTAQAQPDVMEQLAAELAKRPPAPSVLDKYKAEAPLVKPAGLPGAGATVATRPQGEISSVPETAPVATADAIALRGAIQPKILAQIGIDPKAAGKTDSEEYAARYAAQLGAEQAALRATQRQDYELGKTANQEWEAKATPTRADKAIAWGDSAAFGHWGKGGQKMQEQEALFQENKLKRGQGLAALKRVADEGNLADKTKAFEGTEAARSAGRTAAAAQQEKGLAHGTTLAGVDARTLEALQANYQTNKTREQVAADNRALLASNEMIAQKGREDSKEAQFEVHRRDTAMRYAAQAAKDKLSKDLMYGTPNYKGPSEQELALEYFPSFLASLKNETPSVGNDPKTKALEALKKRGVT